MPDTRIYPTSALTARALADSIVEIAEYSINARGRFTIALSGGSTPRQLYELLATREYSERIDWANTHVFFGDERCVPPEHADSNSHMARLALLDSVPIPVSHIYRMPAEREPEQAAIDYEKMLREFFGRREAGAGARFDLVILGVGEDGHTASLFPGSPALDEQERWVMAVYAEHLQSWRLTLTPAAINAAQNICFFVTGEAKADVIGRILIPNEDAEKLPVHYIRGRAAPPRWYLDQAAARRATTSLEWMASKRTSISESDEPKPPATF
jgi:6-phosphogluconolactonase